jgi:heat shock protein HtpX
MRNHIKTFVLMAGLSALLVGVGAAFGQGAMQAALVLAVAMNFVSYFFSDRIVLAIHRARELSVEQAPGLHRIVEELAHRGGMPKPRVYLIPDPQPNAFATGRSPEKGVVAVTSGIMDLLTERELRGVIAHELAHIKNRDILLSSIAATVAAAVTYLTHWVAFFIPRDSDDEGPSGLEALLLMILAPITASMIQFGISRSREFQADATGAELSGDPEALARALEKLHLGAQHVPSHVAQPATASMFIVNPLHAGQVMMSLFSTHPRMEERVRRLRAMAVERTFPGTTARPVWS